MFDHLKAKSSDFQVIYPKMASPKDGFGLFKQVLTKPTSKYPAQSKSLGITAFNSICAINARRYLPVCWRLASLVIWMCGVLP